MVGLGVRLRLVFQSRAWQLSSGSDVCTSFSKTDFWSWSLPCELQSSPEGAQMVYCKSGGCLTILVRTYADIPGVTLSLLPFPGRGVAVDFLARNLSGGLCHFHYLISEIRTWFLCCII
jgi:hypothetical protein